MKMKSVCFFVLSVLMLAACNSEQAAQLGAGIGMAVSNDADKYQGELVGEGIGSLFATE